MKDLPPETSGERDILAVRFGSVVVFKNETKPSSIGYEFLVIQVDHDSSRVEAMRLPRDPSEPYGTAGTEPLQSIERVIGQMAPDEVINCVCRSFMTDPSQKIDPAFRSSIQKLLEKHQD